MFNVLGFILGVFGIVCNAQIHYKNHPSINYSPRAQYIIVHYTAVDLSRSLELLDGTGNLEDGTKSKVSAHYLISDQTTLESKPIVYTLVDEKNIASHAGKSKFHGISALNSTSIGIEITCAAYDLPNQVLKVEKFKSFQIDALAELIKAITDRYNIPATNILGHFEIAPNRKSDPGPLFPWKMLYEKHGIGIWYNEEKVQRYQRLLEKHKFRPSILWIQQALRDYGYDIELTQELDIQTKYVLRAFMMRFLPEQFPGRINHTHHTHPDQIDTKFFNESLEKSLNNKFYAVLNDLVQRYAPERECADLETFLQTYDLKKGTEEKK